MSIDQVGNFLTSIRNAIMVSKRTVTIPHSKLRFGIAQVLEKEGFIKSLHKATDENGNDQIVIALKYVDDESVIHEIKRISRPGRRSYAGATNITPVIGGLGISIVSTNVGIITDKQARNLSVGGEVLCTVW